jgi:hypothetical protein
MGVAKGQVSKSVVILALVAVAMMSVRMGEAAITCGTVESNLLSCLSYLRGTLGAPSQSCCSGVKKLYALTKPSRPDRIAACKCIVQLSTAFGSLQTARVGSLSATCGVPLSYKPSVNTDCSRYP